MSPRDQPKFVLKVRVSKNRIRYNYVFTLRELLATLKGIKVRKEEVLKVYKCSYDEIGII